MLFFFFFSRAKALLRFIFELLYFSMAFHVDSADNAAENFRFALFAIHPTICLLLYIMSLSYAPAT